MASRRAGMGELHQTACGVWREDRQRQQADNGVHAVPRIAPRLQGRLGQRRDHGDLVFDGDAEHQEAAVKTIIALVGEDTPVDVTNRILAAYQKLHACTRHIDEMPSKFAYRFRGLACEYMTLSGISVNGKESQLIAMVLLQNAKLDVNTSNAITIQLVSKAEARKANSSSTTDTVTARRDTVSSMKDMLNSMKDRLSRQVGEAPGGATSYIYNGTDFACRNSCRSEQR